ncbi:LacI family transcriptional regulator [Allocatelliglobosispora scoriae]|uniref:LacI family transcriptional regulator n=1 Tax=Allocatelliglobosispora scoriae TaxID=643052 RepID=A0A841C023_9ACTN|nr:LacI family DNA-binding transcriptional regulator [Allocatelliglobosispora scoriae]MBB5872251.1 LacI family transcriptional regulator [Allocatelliglobosispora scoriae]
MPEIPSTVTLQQVADAAGVSLATASRVLHGSGGRSPTEALRARVEDAATRLHYVSNGPAQALARSTTSIVGLIVHDIADPYFAAIAAGAMRAARAEDLMVMVASTFREPKLELDYVRRLRTQRARAILLAGSAFTTGEFLTELGEELAAYTARGGRVAAIGGHGLGVSAVEPENHEGGRAAGEHLLALGHTAIGVVAGPPQLAAVTHRLAGFREALGPLPCQVATADFTREGGRQATLALLAEHPELTAIFALNDLMALGAMAAARELGRRCPEELSIIGFDDLPTAVDANPPLTTIRLELTELGAAAMSLVLAEETQPPRSILAPATLIPRASTAPAPAPASS